MKKNIIFVLICILLLSGLLYFLNNQTDSVSHTNNDKRLEANSNNIGIGMYDKNNKIIDNGSTLEIQNEKIHSKLSLTHAINNKREYTILALNNFRQTPFEIRGKQYTNYDLQTKENETINVDILNTVNTNTKEIDYLVIKKPNFFLEEFNPDEVGSLQQVLALRYHINNDIDILKEDNLSPSSISNEGPIDNVFLSEKEDKLNALMVSKSEQDIYLTIGNTGNDFMQYAVIALLDWQQVPLINDQFIIYVGVQPGEKKVYKLKLPYVKTKTNYQVLAFPKPYEVSNSDYQSQTVEASIRTVIHP